MNTKAIVFLIISLLTINLSAQESTVPRYFERSQRTLNSGFEPLVFFDDNKIQSIELIGKIDTSNIQEIKVVKKDLDSYIKLYGPDARNGLIFIYSKTFIAKKWYKDFAFENKTINKIIDDPEFNYKDYKVYLNNELLKTDFFDGLNEKLKSQKIKNIKIKKYKSENKKGIIIIETKPDA